MLKRISSEVKAVVIVVAFTTFIGLCSFFGSVYRENELIAIGVPYGLIRNGTLNSGIELMLGIMMSFAPILSIYSFCFVLVLSLSFPLWLVAKRIPYLVRRHPDYFRFSFKDTFYPVQSTVISKLSVTTLFSVLLFLEACAQAYQASKGYGQKDGIAYVRGIDSTQFSTLTYTDGETSKPGRLVMCDESFCIFHNGKSPIIISVSSIREMKNGSQFR